MRISLWHNRNYLLLLSGQVMSLVGTGISQLAYPLLVLALTGVFLQQLGATPTVLMFFSVLLALALVTTLSPHVRNALPLANTSTSSGQFD